MTDTVGVGGIPIWIKLILFLTVVSFFMFLYSVAVSTPGFVQHWRNCDEIEGKAKDKKSGRVQSDTTKSVEELQFEQLCSMVENASVVGLQGLAFLCMLVAIFLSLSVALVDEAKANRGALISLCIFLFLAGLLAVAAVAILETRIHQDTKVRLDGIITVDPKPTSYYVFSSLVGVFSGFCLIIAAVFCVLELCECKPR